MSGDFEQEFFADGIAKDIVTAVSKSHWLFVIARNSSFTYKGKSVDVRRVGRELGVRARRKRSQSWQSRSWPARQRNAAFSAGNRTRPELGVRARIPRHRLLI
jgi:hypothetical protein